MAKCGDMPATFIQMLAACLVKDSGTGTILGINTIDTEPGSNCGCASVVGCDLQGMDAEDLLRRFAFGVDDCGRLALKLTKCKTS